jgi:hypothetical protein
MGTTSQSLTVLRKEGLFLIRSVERLQSFYLAMKQAGVRNALPQPWDIAAGDELKRLLEAFHRLDEQLDWELTAELIRLKDLATERACHYAQLRYGLRIGHPLTLPKAPADFPKTSTVQGIAFLDQPPFELEVVVEGTADDADGPATRLSVLVGPRGVSFRDRVPRPAYRGTKASLA